MKYMETHLFRLKNLGRLFGRLLQNDDNEYFYVVFWIVRETKIMNEMYSFALGMMGFIGTIYYTLYTFVGDSLINKVISFIFFGLWLLYAFAYLLSHKDKNVAYNILDLISKNSFGLFIYLYMIYG